MNTNDKMGSAMVEVGTVNVLEGWEILQRQTDCLRGGLEHGGCGLRPVAALLHHHRASREPGQASNSSLGRHWRGRLLPATVDLRRSYDVLAPFDWLRAGKPPFPPETARLP